MIHCQGPGTKFGSKVAPSSRRGSSNRTFVLHTLHSGDARLWDNRASLLRGLIRGDEPPPSLSLAATNEHGSLTQSNERDKVMDFPQLLRPTGTSAHTHTHTPPQTIGNKRLIHSFTDRKQQIYGTLTPEYGA